VQQVLSGHALQHERRRCLLVHVVWQEHELLRREGAHRHVGPRRWAGVRNAVASAEPRGVALDNDPGCLHADGRRGLDHAVEPLADVDVDVVHADRRLAQAYLAEPWLRGVQALQLQHLGTPERRRHHTLRVHRRPGRGQAAAPSEERREAREASLVHLLADELLELALAAAWHVEG
jgi:hypothetical protein